MRVNRFATDTDEEMAAVEAVAESHGATAVAATHFADGGAGAADLARAVLDRLEEPAKVELLYPDDIGLAEKIETVATRIYGARGVEIEPAAARQLEEFEALGYGNLPVCIAKTQYSFSADPKALGAPDDHVLPVREVRLSAGAGLRGGDHRRDHDHARPAPPAGGPGHRGRRTWPGRGTELNHRGMLP